MKKICSFYTRSTERGKNSSMLTPKIAAVYLLYQLEFYCVLVFLQDSFFLIILLVLGLIFLMGVRTYKII